MDVTENRQAAINELFDALDGDKSGVIDAAEFHRLRQMAELTPSTPQTAGLPPSTPQTAVNVHPPNRYPGFGGGFSAAELEAERRALAPSTAPEVPRGVRHDLDALWDSLDRNHNDFVTREECEAAVASVVPLGVSPDPHDRITAMQQATAAAEVPWGVQPDLDALWNSLDRSRNGRISRQEFEAFRRGQAGTAPNVSQDQYPRGAMPERDLNALWHALKKQQLERSGQGAQPPPQQSTMRSPPPPVAGDVGLKQRYSPYGSVQFRAAPSGDDFEDARAIKDARRAFILGGTSLLCILCILPFWSCLALLRSRTYRYLSGPGSLAGPLFILIVIFVSFWMNIKGVPCVGCPCPNPFSPVGRFVHRLVFVPTETWIVASLVVFLMLLWKALPLFFFGGYRAVLAAFCELLSGMDIVWTSTNPAATILASCVAAVLLYLLSLNYFIAWAKPDVKQGFAYPFAIWSAFLLMLGASFAMFAQPISQEADVAYNELLSACETGVRTRDLFITSQALQSLRQTPGCTELSSVENCLGFFTTTYSNILKQMETELRCSGFCYNPAGVKPLTPQPSALGMANVMQYPPSLFSHANFEASCDGMAARNMQNFVGAVGTQVYHQGVTFSVVALMFGMLVLVGGCGLEKHPRFPDAVYGATL
jgi:hypothetical protein